MTPAPPPLDRTPALERVLAKLRGSLVMLVLLHGVGTVLSVTAAWLVFAFLADWGLEVPRWIRLLHAGLLVALPAWFAWRELVRPLRRIPDREGLAILLERQDPELSELLVSAAQFQARGLASGEDPALAAAVLAEAEERAANLEPRRVARTLDRRPPLLRTLAGVTCAVTTVLLFSFSPSHAEIFLQRMLGSDVPWPRRTALSIELPGLADVEEVAPGELVARIARGSDVPIVVRAHGQVPSEVTLHFEGGAREILARGNAETFRRVLRSCQQDLAFHVTGGDDDDGRPSVRLVVLQPPDVTGLAVRVTPPAYTGLGETVAFNRDVRVLAGSRVSVHALVDPPGTTGQARLLPADELVELASAPFPADPAAADAPAPAEGLAFDLVPTRSLRYRFELVDESGLSNPDPGLFGLDVVEDRPPEISLVAPGRTDFETVAGGTVPLRARVRDDFGLRELGWRVLDAFEDAEDGAVLAGGELALRPAPATPDQVEGAPGDQVTAVRLEVAELFGVAAAADPDAGAPGEEALAEGSQRTLELWARDNRAPDPGEGKSAPVRIRIVSADELMRRVQDRLSRARLDVTALGDLQTEKWRRVDELVQAFRSDDGFETGDARALSSALNGQRRVRGDAESVARELAAICETVLYARLDDKAGPLLERLDELAAEHFDRSFHAATWTRLHDEYRAGELGSAGLAGNLLEILGVALEVSETHVLAAERALEEAQEALDPAAVGARLTAAAGHQTEALARIEDLLERLAEWDSFQSVLTLTRDILNRQSALRQRTQRFASEK